MEDISLPEPKSGEPLIHVRAAGVNPIDWKIRAGYLQQMMPLQSPATSDGDFPESPKSSGSESDHYWELIADVSSNARVSDAIACTARTLSVIH